MSRSRDPLLHFGTPSISLQWVKPETSNLVCGFGTNPRNVGKILNVQKPTTEKELRGLIGLINFYGKFIPKRAEILEHLTRLTGSKCNVQNDWGENQDKSQKSERDHVY